MAGAICARTREGGKTLEPILHASGSQPSQAAAGLPLPRAAPGRQHLVFVRAGRESWHKQLMLEDPDRNWDCCVNWYDAPPEDGLAEYCCGAADSRMASDTVRR